MSKVVDKEKTIQAWITASNDLGFKFNPDYEVDGYLFIGLVPQFGAEKGMLLWQEYDAILGKHLVELGYGYSCITHSLEKYDRQTFIEALTDWGWGDKTLPAPSWYIE